MNVFFALKGSKLFIIIYYIDTLKSELSTAKTYELISTDEKSVVNKTSHISLATKTS